jgi:tRNA-2-methylthio-N6-dimethylallyladenosine synthase
MPRYHIWTVGCQMNEADSAKLAAGLHRLGWLETARPEEADLIVLNTCSVRQKAEDRAVSKLGLLRQLKARRNGELKLVVMGCMVGPRSQHLQERFPFVDVFARPQAFADVLAAVIPEEDLGGEFWPSTFPEPAGPTAYVPVVHGCNKFCTFCIVPYRRGRERSRPIAAVREEMEHLVARGVREVTLLGQTVEAYGYDLPERPSLADLFHAIHDTPGLERIRFLTSYPKDMTDDIIRSVGELPKVCEYFNIPIQSGDDTVLARMRRGYTLTEYRSVVEKIRRWVPGAAISTDVIVGFCGETEEQFRRTYDLLAELRFDKVHVAAYSPRPGTIAQRTMTDDVPQTVKMERLHAVEELQESIAAQINAELVGSVQEVLIEGQKGGKLNSRSRTNKIVHFSADARSGRGRPGDTASVLIEKSSAWSLQGRQVANSAPRPEGGGTDKENDAAAFRLRLGSPPD